MYILMIINHTDTIQLYGLFSLIQFIGEKIQEVNENFLSKLLYKNVRAVPDEKIWGSLRTKHYIFVGLVGVVVFQSSGWLSFVKM